MTRLDSDNWDFTIMVVYILRTMQLIMLTELFSDDDKASERITIEFLHIPHSSRATCGITTHL